MLVALILELADQPFLLSIYRLLFLIESFGRLGGELLRKRRGLFGGDSTGFFELLRATLGATTGRQAEFCRVECFAIERVGSGRLGYMTSEHIVILSM